MFYLPLLCIDIHPKQCIHTNIHIEKGKHGRNIQLVKILEYIYIYLCNVCPTDGVTLFFAVAAPLVIVETKANLLYDLIEVFLFLMDEYRILCTLFTL